VRRLYPQEDLARVLEAPARRVPAASRPADYDVLVVGGGPGGSSAATFLSRGGLTVALAEREVFPRFHVGESLLPANIPVLERLGVLDEVKSRGFLVKYGAYFHDQDMDLAYQFFFREGKPWPPYTYQVQRGEFDKILLDHAARQPNVTLLQPATVERVAFDDDGVTVTISEAAGACEIRARFLVDASGRDAFLASRHGERRPIPGLGKVALFAHFRGGRRWPGREEGNIRIFSFEPGWFWYIPFHNGTTSVGCVLHARTVRGREGNLEQLYESLIAGCHGLRDALGDAVRITDVHSAANFSYRTDPAIGDRFVCVGDAIAFVDPIFSSGVYIATQSAELSSVEILKAFREHRFEARRFRGYERRVRKGMQPFQRFIRHFYDPSFVEMFLKPREFAGMVDGVTGVLAGGAFLRLTLRMRISLEVFFTIVRINRWVRRRQGRPIESRFKW
jgi:2-polyprenyl-6-methoxyphenol hydroxylase-like FAD-dependent oxidoreductase